MKVSEEALEDAGEDLPDPLFDNGMAEIEGDFGSMFIDYETFEPIYRCELCRFKSGERASVEAHLSRDHGIQERYDEIADRKGIEANSRIDRFKRVREVIPKGERADILIDEDKSWASSEAEEPEPEGPVGLDAAPGY